MPPNGRNSATSDQPTLAIPTSRKSESNLLPRKSSGHRRELVWKSPSAGTTLLRDISRQFHEFLKLDPSYSDLDLNHRRGRCVVQTAHRCPGYSRIEIILTTDIKRSAIVSHFTPSPHEICPICKEVVKEAEIVDCICENNGEPAYNHSCPKTDAFNR
jgi:hypothetical protein